MAKIKAQLLYLIPLVATLLLLGYLYFFTSVYSFFTLENLVEFFKQHEDYIVVLFWLINFFAVLLFIPLTLFWVVAGMLLGVFAGTLLTATAATAAATVAFILCRMNAPYFEQLIDKNERSKLWKTKLEDKISENSFTVIYIIRVLPHPFIVFSYIAGLTQSVQLKTFVLATFFAVAPLSIAFVWLGDSLLNDPRVVIIPIVLILLITQLPKLIKRYWNIEL